MKIIKFDTIHPKDYLRQKKEDSRIQIEKFSYEEYLNWLIHLRSNYSDFFTYNLKRYGWEGAEFITDDFDLIRKGVDQIAASKVIYNLQEIEALKLPFIRDLVKAYKPDVIIAREQTGIASNFWNQFRKNSLILGVMSCPMPNPWYVGDYDVLITSTPIFKDFFEASGTPSYLIGNGFDERILNELTLNSPLHDVVFVGGLGAPIFTKRTQLMEYLSRNIEFKWWGYCIEKFDDTCRLKHTWQGQASGLDMFNIFDQAHIVLNDYGREAKGIAVNQRLYEVMGIGSFMLTRHSSNLAKDFPPGIFATFHNKKDCLDKIKYFLRNENERNEIAKAGQKYVLEHFSYKKIMGELHEIIIREFEKKFGRKLLCNNSNGNFDLSCNNRKADNNIAEVDISSGFVSDTFKASNNVSISAIISTFNSERFIRGCLEDLEAQTIADKIEIVVVNSGSKQNEDRVIREFQQKYSNIKYIKTENRETVYQAWNRGIRATSGTFITNANTDDRHRPDAFEIMVRALEENPTVGAVYADNLITDRENETFENNTARQYFSRPNFNLRQILLFCFFGPQPMWRRSVHRKIGYFDESLSVAADYDFFIRLSLEFGAFHIGEILGLYTYRRRSIENSNREKCVSETYQVLKRYRNIVTMEDLYPDLNSQKEPEKAFAACLADQGNCCLFGGLPDIKGALTYYNRSIERGYAVPELAANLGVALVLSGNQSQGVEVLRRIADRVRPAAQNLAIIERCNQKGELPQVGRFKAAEINHPVVLAATRGKGVVIKNNRFMPVETVENHWIGSDMVRNLPSKTGGMVTDGSRPALVSVIVPTFNRPHMLKKTLGSILTQTYQNFEIIVVSDGGEEVSEPIQNFQDDRIKYFQQKSNKGPAAARNTGLKYAKGKYIAYLDDDDFFYPNHLKTLVQFLESSNYKVAYTDAYRIHQEKRGNHYITIKRDLPYSFDFDRDKFLVLNYVPILCFMHEKTCLDNVGFWDETLNTHEDWDLWIRLSREYKFVHIKKVTAGYTWRKDGTSTTSKHRPDFLFTMEKIYQKHEKYVENKPHIKLAQIKYLQELRGKISGAQNTFRCSIIIPVFNQIKFTKHCLETLSKNTPQDLFEAIVIDNHSTDGTKEYLKSLKEKIIVITNSENFGFARACNQGVKAARGEYVLFLNNDTQVEPGWLRALIEVLDKDRTVAAVGSKLLFPDKTIQHAGVLVINDQKLGDPLVTRHIYYQRSENYPKANQICTYQALTAACLIVRKSAFEAVDGFDESYWNGYEDIDLCFKFQQKGWHLVYQPKSVVIHYESQSGPERFRQTGHNIERLHQKWLNKVTPDWIIDANGIVKETNARCIRPYFIPANQNLNHQESDVSFEKLISIVILTHNQLEYTQKCIESVFEHTKEHFELIVVDNGSSDGTVEYLHSKLRDRRPDIRFKILQNKNNLGFATGNNQGIEAARGDYILLMNNDIIVTPGWLESMVSCAERDPKIGIVGPMSNSVSGPQMVKDVTYNITDLDGLDDFAGEFSKRNAGKAKRFMRVVGFCMLIKRAVVDKIGGLDSRYGLGNFEDDDFSLRAALAGFESWMAEDCFIHHFGNRTFIGARIDYNESLTKNWEIFKNKWGLPTDLQLDADYNWSQILKEGFVPEKHCYPLNQRNLVEFGQKDVSSLMPEAGSIKELYQKVQRLVNDGRQEEAVGGLEGLLEKDPDFAMAHNDLGILYYNQGDKEKALNHYEQAVRFEPNNLTFQKNLADFYLVESGRVEDALTIYNKVLEVDFGDVEALMSMGLICEAFQRPEDARHFYNRVLEAEPWNLNARQQLENLYPN